MELPVNSIGCDYETMGKIIGTRAGLETGVWDALAGARTSALLHSAAAVHASVPDLTHHLSHDNPELPEWFDFTHYVFDLVQAAAMKLLRGSVDPGERIPDSLGADDEIRRALPIVFGEFEIDLLADGLRRGHLDVRVQELLAHLLDGDAKTIARASQELAAMHIVYRVLTLTRNTTCRQPQIDAASAETIANWLRDQTLSVSEGAEPDVDAFVEFVTEKVGVDVRGVIVEHTVRLNF